MTACSARVYLAKLLTGNIAGVAIIELVDIAGDFFLLLGGRMEHVSGCELVDSP